MGEDLPLLAGQGQVRVAEDEGGGSAILQQRLEVLGEVLRRPRLVGHQQQMALDGDFCQGRVPLGQGGAVNVAHDGRDRGDGFQVGDDRLVADVAGVENELRALEELEDPGVAKAVGVADDADLHQCSRLGALKR